MQSFNDINGNPIDPIWVAEFCGFFMGEGTIGIYCSTRSYRGSRNRYYFHASASITQRDDCGDVLKEFYDKFGGCLTSAGSENFTNPLAYNYNRKPQITWRVGNRNTVKLIVDILRTSKINHSKSNILDVMDEFLALPRIRGKHISDDEFNIMNELYEKSKRLHLYNKT